MISICEFEILVYGISTTRDHNSGTTAYEFRLCVENIRKANYERTDPNFVMLTPNKEHLAKVIVWKIGKTPMVQSYVNAGNFESLPKELRPQGKIL
ncbi:Uncharacterized protein TCM_019081 [Theobroma cacao]|uniref:Uncharacterized protein n=1 Tax=Theobroma cacao TaxID=3641 RepID=A0A061EHI4_THECC|nr:Uncharacterized protein TCM_019081 [Theobroma cacao]